MKQALLIPMILSVTINAATISNTLSNSTKTDMICIARYPSEYKTKFVNGQKRFIQVYPREERITILKPGASITKARKGTLKCYNQYVKLSSDTRNHIDIIDAQHNPYALESHRSWFERYDLTRYERKTRSDIAKVFGIPQRCAPYKKGQYCNIGFGLDVYFDENNRVRKLFLYGNTVNGGKLPFEPHSILKLRNNRDPLGLWVQKSYKKLFTKAPDFVTECVIIWDQPNTIIKRVIMTAKNCHFKLSYKIKDGHNLYADDRNLSRTPKDYLNAVEVEYE